MTNRKAAKERALGKPASGQSLKIQKMENFLGDLGGREAVVANIAQQADRFPGLLEQALRLCRQTDPLGLLAAAAHYGLTGSVGADGVARPAPNYIEQQFVELFQAIALTLPSEEWGATIVVPAEVQTLFDLLPELGRTFPMARWAAQASPDAPEANAVSALQERLRLYTQSVRNWGYYTEAVALSKTLYGPLDDVFMAKLGFGPSQLIEVVRLLVIEAEKRSTDHMTLMAKALQGGTAQQILERYFRLKPFMHGAAADALRHLPPNPTRENAMAAVMAHHDVGVTALRTFSVEDIVGLTHFEAGIVEAVFKGLSLTPGALAGRSLEHFFLSNPIWSAPGILNPDGSLFMAIPQLVFSHIHDLIRRLALSCGLEEAVETRRAVFLEEATEAQFKSALPTARLQTGIKWKVENAQFETDLTAVLGTTLVIVEAKSHRLTPEGLRGAPDRMKRHIRDLVLKPSEQSARLEELLRDAKAGDAKARAVLTPFNFDPSDIDRVIRLSLLLDNFDILATDELGLKAAGWVPEAHALAPAIQIADLPPIIEILDHPILFLHYLTERARLQNDVTVFGDALDLLGVYLDTGLVLDDQIEKGIQIQLLGMSDKIDVYFEGRAQGGRPRKPKPQLAPYVSAVLGALMEKQPEHWISIAIDFLQIGGLEKQTALGDQVYLLRNRARRKPTDRFFIDRLFFKPENRTRPALAFYAHSGVTAEVRDAALHALAQDLAADGYATQLVFSVPARDSSVPFDHVLYSRT
jgi:hypothetical protein